MRKEPLPRFKPRIVAWVICALALLFHPRLLPAAEFMAGADMSHLGFFEARGVIYRDSGDVRDALVILKSRGLNWIRLRLFTSSPAQAANNPYNYINNLDYTLPLAVRAKKAGLRLLLDFHYSDTWADPGHQSIPTAWTNLGFSSLLKEFRAYNSNCIAAFLAAGVRPDCVQVGNEITSGLLWPEGRVGGGYDTPAQWSKLGQLLKAAIQGIKDASGAQPPSIMVHIDRGGSWSGTQWFFDRLLAQQVEFDLIGESYYPFWHGSLQDLNNCLTNAAARYRKPVVVAETAFPWSNSTNLYGIPASPEGQVQYMGALARVVKGVPGLKGAGIFWWGAEYQRLEGIGLAGFDKKSLFDSNGDVLPVADALGQLAAPVRLNADLEDGSLALRWPLSGAGFFLMASSNPGSPGTWLRVTNPIQITGTGLWAVIPLERNMSRCFRLQTE